MTPKINEANWKKALTHILEELDESQFRKLQSYLDKIPLGVKADKVREEMAQIIIQYYGPEESIAVVNKAVDEIPRKDAAVQDLLRPFVEKMKSIRKQLREERSKPAAGSGSVTKKKESPAGGSTQTLGQKSKPAVPVTRKQEPLAAMKSKATTASESASRRKEPPAEKAPKPTTKPAPKLTMKPTTKPAPAPGATSRKKDVPLGSPGCRRPSQGSQQSAQCEKKKKTPLGQKGSVRPGAK